MERALGSRRHLPLRPHQDPRPDLRHRHAAADGQRLASRRSRVLLHPHRHDRPLQAHAGPRGVVPDRLGRQRAADRAPGPELLRGALRPLHALRPGVRATGGTAEAAPLDLPARTSSSCASGSPKTTSTPSRSCGAGSGCPSTGPTPTRPSARESQRRLAARIPSRPGPRRCLHRSRPDALGRRLPDRGLPRPSSRTATRPAPSTGSPSIVPTAATCSSTRPARSCWPPVSRWSPIPTTSASGPCSAPP